jgi:hypothetical protein
VWRRWISAKKSDRLRMIGCGWLGSSALAAAIFYWWAIRSLAPELNDENALGYTRAAQHDMGMMLGQSGLVLANFHEWLWSPAGEAAMIVAGALLVAAFIFRAAWVLDENERLARNA